MKKRGSSFGNLAGSLPPGLTGKRCFPRFVGRFAGERRSRPLTNRLTLTFVLLQGHEIVRSVIVNLVRVASIKAAICTVALTVKDSRPAV